ncbi:MAG: hypothetical protein NWQ46_07995 [Spirosomaceae bacterium]|nr:hypothetical protein [Spirosomataceae bacterium]
MKTLLLLLLASCTASGQYIEKYYPLINQAELAIVDSNYQQAFTHYRTAFSNVERPRGTDYMNAAKCAFLVFDETSGKFYLRKLVGYGYNLEGLKSDVQQALFRDALNDVAFTELLEAKAKEYDEEQNKEWANNKPLIETFRKLNRKRELETDKNDNVAMEILNREFTEYLQQKWEAGFDFSNRFEQYLLVNLLQDESISFSEKKLEKTLIAAVDAGNLSPEDAYGILAVRKYDFLNVSERLLTKVSVNPFVCEDKGTIEPFVDKWLTDKQLIASKTGQKIDEIRKQFAHESLTDELKKRIHSMICNDECNFDLRCPRQHTRYPTNCEQTKELLNGMELFEMEGFVN